MRCGFFKHFSFQMGCRTDPTFPPFKSYRLKCVQNQIRKTKILPSEVRQFRQEQISKAPEFDKRHKNGLVINEDIDSKVNSNKEMMRANKKLYRCRRCRVILFTQAGVLPHREGEALTWESLLEEREAAESAAAVAAEAEAADSADSNGDNLILDYALQRPAECKHGVFVEPVRWMEAAFRGVSGRLCCSRCGGKLGAFSWSCEVMCACGAVASPGFVVHLSRVDVCTMLKEVEADV